MNSPRDDAGETGKNYTLLCFPAGPGSRGELKVLYGKIVVLCLFLVFAFPLDSAYASGQEDIIFTFEDSTEGWVVPDWAYELKDYVAEEVVLTRETVSSGSGALEVICDFPGTRWTAALVELEKDMDLTDYDLISAQVYIPRGAPRGFMKARFILTVGVGWHFVEMRRPVDLIPGRWTTISVEIEKEDTMISPWRGHGEGSLRNNLDAVKKIAVRIEYDAAPPHVTGGRYRGSVFVDNVIISRSAD